MIRKTNLPLLFALWIGACAVLIITRSSPLITGELGDTDDYLRLVRVFAFLDGQVRDSYVVERMGPAGGGVAWSPLIDWLLAASVKTGTLFTDRHRAALWTASLYPLFLLLFFMGAAYWYVRQAGDKATALRAPVTLLFLCALLVQFAPGRVDHHNVQAVILALACGFLIRLYNMPLDKGPALAAGFLMALAWSIGAEAVPWAGSMTAAIAVFWLFRGREFLKAGQVFSAALLAFSIVLLPLTRGFDGFFVMECDGISLSFLAYAAAAVLFWQGMALLPAAFVASPAGRFRAGGVWALMIAGGLYAILPGCLSDPYSVGDPDLRRIWLEHVDEARPALSFWDREKGLVIFSWGVLLPALATAVWAMKAEPDRRALWGGFSFMLLAATLLALWQIRTAYLGQVITIFPLSWLLVHMGRRYGALPRRVRLALSGAFFTGALAAFLIAVPSSGGTPTATGSKGCDIKAASLVLNQLERPQVIAAYVIDGGELLFRTPHRVLAGSYHRNAEGILAAHNILSASSPAAARELADRYGVTILLVCEENLDYWDSTSAAERSFAGELMEGHLPAWIGTVSGSSDTGFGIFLVRPPNSE